MAQFTGQGADATALGDDVSCAHVRRVRYKRTMVKNVDNVRLFRDTGRMKNATTGSLLRALKDRAGLTLDDIARDGGYEGKSGVQAFFNESYVKPLDTKVAKKLADALEGKGEPPIRREEVLVLTDAATIDRAPDLPPTVKSEEGSIPLRHLDLSLSMGDGTKLEDHYEEGVFEFDAALLRTISRAPAHRLVVGQGIGDSMQPTLHDRDMLIFDTTQTVLSGTDRIWAISLFGAGGVKRLRPVAKDRVLVMSDNPTVPDQEVSTEDLRILGRVIWSARRH